SGGEAAALPADAEPLSPKITAPKALARALAHVGVIQDAAVGDRLAASLPPGVILVTKVGGMWRWDGLVRRPGAASAAAARLEQRNRLEHVEREFAEADKAAKAAGEALAAIEAKLSATSASEK